MIRGNAARKKKPPQMPRARGVSQGRAHQALALGSRRGLADYYSVSQPFSSTDQYAFSRNVFHDRYLLWVSLRLSSGLRLGFSGFRMRCMCASFGVRPPFLTLQLTQAQTMFSHVLVPPWLRGTT